MGKGSKTSTPAPKNKKAAQAEDDEEDDDETEEEEEVEETEDSDDETEDSDDESDDDEEDKPAKKSKKGGRGNPENLVPREPVKVPKDVLKAQSKEIQALLKKREELQANGDKKGLRKLRAELRKKGFRLSNLPGGQLKKKGEESDD